MKKIFLLKEGKTIYKYKNKLVEEKFSISTNSFNENKVLN